MKQKWYDKIPKILKNKYLITGVIFLVWIIFLDSSNLIFRSKTKKELNELKKEKQHYINEIKKDSILYHSLLNDSTELEKYAREKYLIKRKNEDLFIIIDTLKNTEE